MAKTTFRSAEELREAWNRRQARIQAQTPRTFRSYCAQAHQMSLYHMNRQVYMQNSPNKRMGGAGRGGARRQRAEGAAHAALVIDLGNRTQLVRDRRGRGRSGRNAGRPSVIDLGDRTRPGRSGRDGGPTPSR
jgi:hypothetical protein